MYLDGCRQYSQLLEVECTSKTEKQTLKYLTENYSKVRGSIKKLGRA